METLNKSIGEQLSLWTSSAADIPASHLVQQANDKEQTTQDTCGPGCEQPLASYDPDTQSWRMFGDISLWGEFKLLESLPKSGMTRNGVLYQQPVWVRLIDEIASSLWPTPTAHPDNSNLKGKFKNPTLGDAVRMWPTPTARDWKGAAGFKSAKRNLSDLTFLAQVRDGHRLSEYPTMSANGMGNTGSQQILQRKVESGEMTEQEKKRMTAGNGGSLNPTWVEWLMGFPTGWTDLED